MFFFFFLLLLDFFPASTSSITLILLSAKSLTVFLDKAPKKKKKPKEKKKNRQDDFAEHGAEISKQNKKIELYTRLNFYSSSSSMGLFYRRFFYPDHKRIILGGERVKAATAEWYSSKKIIPRPTPEVQPK